MSKVRPEISEPDRGVELDDRKAERREEQYPVYNRQQARFWATRRLAEETCGRNQAAKEDRDGEL